MTHEAVNARLRAARAELDELRELVADGTTRRGECETCHQATIPIYVDPRAPGDFDICRGCIEKARQRAARRVQVAQQDARAAGLAECRTCHEFRPADRSCGCTDPAGVQ